MYHWGLHFKIKILGGHHHSDHIDIFTILNFSTIPALLSINQVIYNWAAFYFLTLHLFST
jgi:hypothetical protein